MTFSHERQRATVLIVACGLALGCGADGDGDDGVAKVGSGGAGGDQGMQMSGAGKGGAGKSALGSGGRAASGDAGSGGSAGSGNGGSGKSAGGTGGAILADAGAMSFCRDGEKKIGEGETVPASDGCNSCTCTAGMLQCTTIACAPTCVVAKHLDDCCGMYEPVLSTALAADECLVEYPATGVDAARVQACLAKSPVNCATVLCAEEMPLSRVAIEDGMGGCRYSDECQNNEDCVLVADTNACCACTQSVPASLLERNACLSRQNPAAIRVPPLPVCPGCTAPVQCGACPAPPEMATCLILDSFSRCQ